MEKIWKFIKDEDGLESVEYAIIAGLIVIGIVAAISTIGTNVASIFSDLASDTTTAAGS